MGWLTDHIVVENIDLNRHVNRRRTGIICRYEVRFYAQVIVTGTNACSGKLHSA